MKEFIDDEITSSELIQDLNGGLQELLRSQHAKEYFSSMIASGKKWKKSEFWG